ncbi:SCO6880 family protein [Jiangella muralis]|uniref:SCO6880 family protein n=1 Tax=Jiangella muralis TaxID=702383 RepID=UPI0012F9B7A5|nr:SCO6880 family protein [Jiangella muralis]
MVVEETPGRSVLFAPRPRRGIIVGLQAGQLVVLAVGLLVAIPAVYTGGVARLAATAPLWGAMVAAAFVTVAGRTLVSWAPIAVHHAWRAVARQLTYRIRVPRPPEAGRLALPGEAAGLRLHVHPGMAAAMVHDPRARTLTAALRVRSAGTFVLADTREQERRSDAWGGLLAGYCTGGRLISRIQVLERTMPESGISADAFWQAHGVDDDGWASQSYREVLATAAPTSERHETLIALTLDLRVAARQVRAAGGGVAGAADVLAQQLTLLARRLPSLDLAHDGWVTAPDLALLLRGAFDPTGLAQLARSNVGRTPGSAGPVAINEGWAGFQADSSWHCVLWVAEWPRVAVPVDVLWPLLLTSGVHRTVSVTFEPIPHDRALRAVRQERVEHESDARQRARSDVLTTETQRREAGDAVRRERELVAGAGDMRYVGLVTVSAPDQQALDVAVEQVKTAAAEAHCELRILYGQQTQAFTAAAIPLARGMQ